MPIYEFRCEQCSHVLEALRRMGEGPEGLACPECGSGKLSQVFSTFAATSAQPGGGRSAGDAPCGAPSCGSGFS